MKSNFNPILKLMKKDLHPCLLGYPPGGYPWDDWKTKALSLGVRPDVANMGRSVMREAHQHVWDDKLHILCGWGDDGKRMIKLALRSPDKAYKRWGRLLATDGNRGECDEKTGEWIPFL